MYLMYLNGLNLYVEHFELSLTFGSDELEFTQDCIQFIITWAKIPLLSN